MKVAVVYFSLEGNTKYAAEMIARELDADLIKLVPAKPYPTGNAGKYFWCGKSSVFGESPKLEAYPFDPNNYDLVVLGTPIWAGTLTPPLRTFLRENRLAGKKAALFACCSGGPTDKCFEEMRREIPDCTVLSTLRIVDAVKNPDAEVNDKIIEFCNKLKMDLMD